MDVISLFLQDPRNRADDLHYETRGIFAERSWPVPEPLRQLAAITHFNLFVSIAIRLDHSGERPDCVRQIRALIGGALQADAA
jgi:hypothetical protein